MSLFSRRRFWVKLVASTLAKPYKITAKGHLAPSESFHVQTYSAYTPHIKREDWTLTLAGLPEPHQFTWENIKQLPAVDSLRTIECITNPTGGDMIGTALWRGIRLRDLLQPFPLDRRITHAKFTALDGYQTAIPLPTLLHEDTLLAYAMNGAPLTPAHGYPLRLLVGGTYGQKMPKWITQIEFIDQPFLGHWEKLGWSDEATVQTHALVTDVHIKDKVMVQGLAFAGKREITAVEVRIEGGEWLPAQLLKPPSPLVCTAWTFTWVPPAVGLYTLEVRATDDEGFTQHEYPNPFFKRQSKTGNALIQQITLEVTT